MPIGDDRTASLPALLLGRAFTHRVSELEVELGFLSIYPDLKPISLLTEDETYQRLVDGTPLVEVLPDYDAELLAERGVPEDAAPEIAWLLDRNAVSRLGVAAGELISVTVRPDGFELSPAHVSEAAADQPGRWAATFAVDDGEPRDLSSAV